MNTEEARNFNAIWLRRKWAIILLSALLGMSIVVILVCIGTPNNWEGLITVSALTLIISGVALYILYDTGTYLNYVQKTFEIWGDYGRMYIIEKREAGESV